MKWTPTSWWVLLEGLLWFGGDPEQDTLYKPSASDNLPCSKQDFVFLPYNVCTSFIHVSPSLKINQLLRINYYAIKVYGKAVLFHKMLHVTKYTVEQKLFVRTLWELCCSAQVCSAMAEFSVSHLLVADWSSLIWVSQGSFVFTTILLPTAATSPVYHTSIT